MDEKPEDTPNEFAFILTERALKAALVCAQEGISPEEIISDILLSGTEWGML